MSTIKIKTQNGYEKVEIPSCLPANVEFGEPEDWSSKKDGSTFVPDKDGILTSIFGTTSNAWTTIRENNVGIAGVTTTVGNYHSLTAPIRKGETYNFLASGSSFTSDAQFIFYPFKTKPVNDYSTNEQVIGKWIDGKPLYRRVVEVTNAFTVGGSKTNEIYSIKDFDEVIDAKYIVNGIPILSSLYHSDLSKYAYDAYFQKAGTDNHFRVDTIASSSAIVVGETLKCILEYTKTTD